MPLSPDARWEAFHPLPLCVATALLRLRPWQLSFRGREFLHSAQLRAVSGNPPSWSAPLRTRRCTHRRTVGSVFTATASKARQQEQRHQQTTRGGGAWQSAATTQPWGGWKANNCISVGEGVKAYLGTRSPSGWRCGISAGCRERCGEPPLAIWPGGGSGENTDTWLPEAPCPCWRCWSSIAWRASPWHSCWLQYTALAGRRRSRLPGMWSSSEKSRARSWTQQRPRGASLRWASAKCGCNSRHPDRMRERRRRGPSSGWRWWVLKRRQRERLEKV